MEFLENSKISSLSSFNTLRLFSQMFWSYLEAAHRSGMKLLQDVFHSYLRICTTVMLTWEMRLSSHCIMRPTTNCLMLVLEASLMACHFVLICSSRILIAKNLVSFILQNA
jgi:hypothetical protein